MKFRKKLIKILKNRKKNHAKGLIDSLARNYPIKLINIDSESIDNLMHLISITYNRLTHRKSNLFRVFKLTMNTSIVVRNMSHCSNQLKKSMHGRSQNSF